MGQAAKQGRSSAGAEFSLSDAPIVPVPREAASREDRTGGTPGGGGAALTEADHLRAQIANALTAILLHSEVIRREAAAYGGAVPSVEHTTEHIVLNAKRIWRLLGPAGSTSTA